MKFSKKIIASALLISASAFAFAADDVTNITINVNTDPLLEFTGSLANDINLDRSVADLNGTQNTLGTLGTTSNFLGGCDLTVSTLNDFKLLHTTAGTPTYLHGANANYTFNFGSDSFTNTTANALSLASCTNADRAVTINTPGFDANNVLAGLYSDTITVTIATQ